jgi:tetratricopeptide (TPR) repeat protein
MLKEPQSPPTIHDTAALKKSKNPQFIIFITIIFIALAIIVIWILSSLGSIPGYWATALSVSSTVIGIIIAILPSISAAHEKSSAPSPIPTAVPVIVKIHTDQLSAPLAEALAAPAATNYRSMAGLPPPTNARAIQQRQPEVRSIYQQLIQEDTTAIVLTGIGGIGKSTLAALIYHYAEAQRLLAAEPFTAPAIWLRVDPAMTMVDFIGTLFELIDKPVPGFNTMFPQEQATRLFNMLNTISQPRLIVLDQFENLLDWQTGHTLTSRPGIGEWLDAINSQHCRCRILLTSRPWPRGTREYPSIHMQEYRVAGLTSDEGMQLLRQQEVAGTDEELQKAVAYCNGHAFALILLASLTRNHNLNLRALFRDATYTQLWEGDIARNLLDNIYTQQLNPLQRRLLNSFSIYREPVRLEAASSILEIESGTSTIQNALYAVMGQHLLQATGNGCYQLHTMVASYAQSHFDEGDDQTNQQILIAAHKKAAAYYLRQAAKTSPSQEKRRDVNDIQPFLEAIWHHCQAQQWQAAYDLIKNEAIFSTLKRWGRNATLLEICQTLLQSTQWSSLSLQCADICNNLGDVCWILGQVEQARFYYNRTLQICQDIPAPFEEGWARNNLGRIYNTLGKSEKAQEYLEQALELFKHISNHTGEGRCITNLGWLYYDRGNMEQALEYFQQALHIFRDGDDQREEGLAYGYLGRVHGDMGHSRVAQKYYAQALEVLSEIGDQNGIGIMHCNQGRISNRLGHHQQALEHLKQALEILREIGDLSGEATALNDLGETYSDLGKEELAIQTLEQALRIRKEVGNRRGEARTLTDLGKIYAHLKQMEKAQMYFEQALHVLDKIEHSWRDGRTLKNLGRIYILMEKNDLALQCYAKALHSYTKVDNRWEAGVILFELGLLYFAHQKYASALPFFILAQSTDQEVEDTYKDKIQAQITLVSTKMSQQDFDALRSNTSTQMEQLIEKTLENVEF